MPVEVARARRRTRDVMVLLLCWLHCLVPRFHCFQQQGRSSVKSLKDLMHCPKSVCFLVQVLTLPSSPQCPSSVQDFSKILNYSHGASFPHCSKDTYGNALEGAGILLLQCFWRVLNLGFAIFFWLARQKQKMCQALGSRKWQSWCGSLVPGRVSSVLAWPHRKSSVVEAALPLLLSEDALVCRDAWSRLSLKPGKLWADSGLGWESIYSTQYFLINGCTSHMGFKKASPSRWKAVWLTAHFQNRKTTGSCFLRGNADDTHEK